MPQPEFLLATSYQGSGHNLHAHSTNRKTLWRTETAPALHYISSINIDLTADTFKRYKLVLLPEYLSELEALLLKKNNFSDEATKAHREAVSVAPDEAPILTMFGQSLLSSGYEEGTNYMALAEAAKIREEARSHGQHSHIPPVQPTKKEN
jgi:Tfp pilus assembly protein PilF